LGSHSLFVWFAVAAFSLPKKVALATQLHTHTRFGLVRLLPFGFTTLHTFGSHTHTLVLGLVCTVWLFYFTFGCLLVGSHVRLVTVCLQFTVVTFAVTFAVSSGLHGLRLVWLPHYLVVGLRLFTFTFTVHGYTGWLVTEGEVTHTTGLHFTPFWFAGLVYSSGALRFTTAGLRLRARARLRVYTPAAPRFTLFLHTGWFFYRHTFYVHALPSGFGATWFTRFTFIGFTGLHRFTHFAVTHTHGLYPTLHTHTHTQVWFTVYVPTRFTLRSHTVHTRLGLHGFTHHTGSRTRFTVFTRFTFWFVRSFGWVLRTHLVKTRSSSGYVTPHWLLRYVPTHGCLLVTQFSWFGLLHYTVYVTHTHFGLPLPGLLPHSPPTHTHFTHTLPPLQLHTLYTLPTHTAYLYP